MEDMIDAPMSITTSFFDGKDYLIAGLDKGYVQMYDISKSVGGLLTSISCVTKVYTT